MVCSEQKRKNKRESMRRERSYTKRFVSFLQMLILLVLLGGCVIERNGSFCEIYQDPLYFTRDTPKDLQERITVLNEAWEYYCEE